MSQEAAFDYLNLEEMKGFICADRTSGGVYLGKLKIFFALPINTSTL